MPSKLEKKIHITKYNADGYVANLHSTIGVIITHPWGPLGGNMHNNVVNAVAYYFQRLGITTIRFDFAGSQIGYGYYQVEQVQYIAKQLLGGELFMNTNNDNNEEQDQQIQNNIVVANHDDDEEDYIELNQTPASQSSNNSKKIKNRYIGIVPKYIMLIGYSYGSLIANSASSLIPQCICTISIAPPFGVSHWLLMFHNEYHMKQSMKRTEQYFKRLFIIGTNDNFTSETKFITTIEKYYTKTIIPPKHQQQQNEQKQQQNQQQNIETSFSSQYSLSSSSTNTLLSLASAAILKDADHFFVRREKDVLDIIGQWLMTTAYPNECHNDLNLLKSIEMNIYISDNNNNCNDDDDNNNNATNNTCVIPFT